MKLIALMPCRNEAWVLGLTARAALMWCDEVIALDHASTDRTAEILSEIHQEEGRLHWFHVSDPQWDEMAHRQKLLGCARVSGATHIAIIDADEILTGNLIGNIGRHVRGFSSDHILQFPLYNLRGSINRYHANGLWGCRTVSVAFADSPELHWGGDRFHHREPMGRRLTGYCPISQGAGGVLHLWGCSERRLKAKHDLYKVTERIRWPDKDVRDIDFTYSQAFKGSIREDPSKWTFAETPAAWWEPYAHLMKYLDVDAEPWQEAETRRLVEEHGREYFKGLTLFSA